jgi:hypothetical protein
MFRGGLTLAASKSKSFFSVNVLARRDSFLNTKKETNLNLTIFKGRQAFICEPKKKRKLRN